MAKKEIVIIADYTATTPLTLAELCEVCGINSDIIIHFIEYQIIEPQGASPDEWLFELAHMQRIKTALRLQRDLEVNLPGVALVLDLLDEIDEMHARIELLEKQFPR